MKSLSKSIYVMIIFGYCGHFWCRDL